MATILISTVGDTDPIRNFHDGALLHITRKYRPDKIIVIHSERTVSRQERIVTAVASISDSYHPEMIQHPELLPNAEVALFDRMYERMSQILQVYLNKTDQFILNLSSGTPQMKAGQFITNRLNDINVKAVQVTSPIDSSNEEVKHDNDEDIHVLIEMNEDARENFVDRTVEDTSEKFEQALLRRTVRTLIENYDYKAALDILNQMAADDQIKSARVELADMVDALNRQDIPKRLVKRKMNQLDKQVLNAYLMIDLQRKRGNVSESLVRIKSLAEFILEDYISRRYPKALDRLEKTFLSIWDYRRVLKEQGEWQLMKTIKPILDLVESRNTIAHSVEPLQAEEIKRLGEAQQALKQLLLDFYSFDRGLFSFYDDMNSLLLERLT